MVNVADPLQIIIKGIQFSVLTRNLAERPAGATIA